LEIAEHSRASDPRYYEGFYAGGGWKYGLKKEEQWLRKRLVEPLWLKPCRVLDLGCGTGAHTEAWRRLGYDSVGVDVSAAGVARARSEWPESQFLQGDAGKLPFADGTFGIVFVRGMSWYHRDLDDKLRERTRTLCRLLRPYGVFVLAIRTDYSGRQDETTIIHNKLESYLALFEPLGEIVLCTDWEGRDVRHEGTKGAQNILIAVRPTSAITSTGSVQAASDPSRDYDVVHEAILSLIPHEGRVLDVACGAGVLCRKIMRRHADASVTGIDGSAYAITRNIEQDRHLGIEYICGDIRTELRTLAGDFDVVILHDVIQHLDDVTSVCDAAAALLGKGGSLIVTCPHDNGVPHAAPLHQWGHDQLFHMLAKYGRRVSFQHFDAPRQQCLLAYVRTASAPGTQLTYEEQLRELSEGIEELALENAAQRESIRLFEKALQRAATHTHRLASAIDQQAGILENLGAEAHRYAAETGEAPGRLALVRIVRAVTERTLPPNARVLVVSRGDDDLLVLGGYRTEHFPQSDDGSYAGYHPADSAEVIARLKALRQDERDYLLFPATAFWWLDFYQELRGHLESEHRRVWSDEHCIIYWLGAA
jgi:SAM-dependent methyltransferase